MKKVMFIIVGMLFALNVNAASLVLTNISGGATTLTPGASVYGSSTVTGDEAVNSSWALSTDTDTNAAFSIGFSSLSSGISVSQVIDNAWVQLLKDGATILTVGPADVFGFTFSYLLESASSYTLNIFGDASGITPTTTQLSVSAVPIPAALFLFAPALLGFFGLRRKAAVAA